MPITDPDRIRRRREELLLSQLDLAVKSGVSTKTIYNIESGEASPRQATRRRVLEALGIPYEEHFSIFGPMPRR